MQLLSRMVIVASIVFSLTLMTQAAPDIALKDKPYMTGGLFTNPLLPNEGDEVTITVRVNVDGDLSADPMATVTVVSPDGRKVLEKKLVLKPGKGKTAEASLVWKAVNNGLYKVRASVDPDNRIAEANEKNNTGEIRLPVIVKGKKLYFPYYYEDPLSRWSNVITAAVTDNIKNTRVRLAERGVLPLYWDWGRNWPHGPIKATEPQKQLEELSEQYFQRYTRKSHEIHGLGIDETGGYADSLSEKKGVAILKALARVKKKMPERFIAVWHDGGIRAELAQYYREGVDLLLLETYVWRSWPWQFGTEDIYQKIRNQLDPFLRANNSIVPAHEHKCNTLASLDTSERPDWIDLGEMEQVVRFIRRICPEMRGVSWFNGGYGAFGLKRTPETDKHHEAVLANADRLSYEYFIMPCVTLQRESLWMHPNSDKSLELTLALSNIGGMDSGPVTVEFLMDGKVIATKTAKKVPAGRSRLFSKVLLKHKITPTPGLHTFEARIVKAPGSTVLDAHMVETRFVQDNSSSVIGASAGEERLAQKKEMGIDAGCAPSLE